MSIAELKLAVAAPVLALTLTGCGLMEPSGSPGYAELASPGWRDVDSTFTLSLGPTLLGLAAQSVQDEPEIRTMLANLEGIRLRIYAIEGDTAPVTDRINELGAALRKQQWEPVIRVNDPDETVHLLVKTVDDEIVGLVLLSVDDSEVVMVNVIGSLQPEMLNTALAALPVD